MHGRTFYRESRPSGRSLAQLVATPDGRETCSAGGRLLCRMYRRVFNPVSFKELASWLD